MNLYFLFAISDCLCILLLLVLRLLAGIEPHVQVNRVLGTVDNDSECSLAIAWCSGRDRLEACIVKVVPPQIDVSSYRKIGTPIVASGGIRAKVDR